MRFSYFAGRVLPSDDSASFREAYKTVGDYTGCKRGHAEEPPACSQQQSIRSAKLVLKARKPLLIGKANAEAEAATKVRPAAGNSKLSRFLFANDQPPASQLG